MYSDPEMYTDVGNRAVINAIRKIEAMVETDLTIRNRETLVKAAAPVLRSVAAIHEELWDTEPRGWVADQLDSICAKYGWEFNEFQGYDW